MDTKMSKEIIAQQLAPEVQLLADTIRNEIETGKERAFLAMEQEKRTIYWNVGKLIKEHLLQNAERADYGNFIVSQLSSELSLPRNVLYDSIKFYEQFPEIVHLNAQLTWSHARVLVHIPETKDRQEYEKAVVEKKLTVAELKNLVKSGKTEKSAEQKKLSVTRGEPYFYRLKKVQDKTVIDLGFRFFIESDISMDDFVRKNNSSKDEESKVIQSHKDGGEYQFFDNSDLIVPHYTYKAFLLDVIDGDTIWVNIDLGFGAWTTQKLRLKGINTKAVETSEGKGAKEFMESCLKRCKFIAVKTYWRDKFTRYLADIFYIQREDDFKKVIREGRFLNQAMLDEGLAARF